MHLLAMNAPEALRAQQLPRGMLLSLPSALQQESSRVHWQPWRPPLCAAPHCERRSRLQLCEVQLGQRTASTGRIGRRGRGWKERR